MKRKYASYFDIVAAMKYRTKIMCVTKSQTRPCMIQAIKLEDGGGRRWIVTLLFSGTEESIYWDEDGGSTVEFLLS